MEYASNFSARRDFDLTPFSFESQDLEDECLKPEPSHKLLEIGLCLLKWISSHRGLTYVLLIQLFHCPFADTDCDAGPTISTSTPDVNIMRKLLIFRIPLEKAKLLCDSSISTSS